MAFVDLVHLNWKRQRVQKYYLVDAATVKSSRALMPESDKCQRRTLCLVS